MTDAPFKDVKVGQPVWYADGREEKVSFVVSGGNFDVDEFSYTPNGSLYACESLGQIIYPYPVELKRKPRKVWVKKEVKRGSGFPENAMLAITKDEFIDGCHYSVAGDGHQFFVVAVPENAHNVTCTYEIKEDEKL